MKYTSPFVKASGKASELVQGPPGRSTDLGVANKLGMNTMQPPEIEYAGRASDLVQSQPGIGHDGGPAGRTFPPVGTVHD